MSLVGQEGVRRRAELQKSLWPYWTLLGLAWVAWLHLGILTRTTRHFVFALIYAALYGVPLAVLATSPPPSGQEPPNPVAGLVALVYIVGMIHVFRERRNLRVAFEEVPALRDVPADRGQVSIPSAAIPLARAADQAIDTTARQVPVPDDWLRKKCGVDTDEDWISARVIPIVPCVEEPDGSNEVIAQWKRRSLLGQLMRLFNFLYDHRFYSAITVFNDHFYITQTSLWFGLLPLFWVPRRTEVLRRHQRDDILRLVISRTDNAPAAYDHLYASSDNRTTSNETFRLYARAGGDGNPIAKYVFKVANDTGSTPISLEEALGRLHQLVPAPRQATEPFTSGRKEKLGMTNRRKARAQTVIAWMCFGVAAVFAVLMVATMAGLTDPPDLVVALTLSGAMIAVFGGFGWRALHLRNKLRAAEPAGSTLVAL